MPLSSRETIIEQLLAVRDIPGIEQVFCLYGQKCPLNLEHSSLSETNMRVPSIHEFIRTKIIITVTRRIEV